MVEVLPETVKERVKDRYLCSTDGMEPHFGDLYVDQITVRTVAKFVSHRKRRGISNRTIQNDLTALSSLMRSCVAWGWIEANPVKMFDRDIVRARRSIITLPTQEDVDALVEEAPDMFGRFLRCLEQTGMREDECSSLERKQVDFKRKSITLTRTKTDRPRVIPLDDKITSRAGGTIRGTPAHLKKPFVFWHHDGERFNNASSQFGAIRRRLNTKRRKADLPEVRFRLHDLRHKFAVDYLRAGGNIYTLQKIMGHDSIKTTEDYLRYLTPEEQQNAKYGVAQKGAQV